MSSLTNLNSSENLLEQSFAGIRESISKKGFLENRRSRQLRIEKVVAAINIVLETITNDSSCRYRLFDQEFISLMTLVLENRKDYDSSVIKKVFDIFVLIGTDEEAINKGKETYIVSQTQSNCYWNHAFFSSLMTFLDVPTSQHDVLTVLHSMLYDVDCCLAFRKEGGLYSLLNIFHSSTEEKVRALCQSIVRRILQLNAELFLMSLTYTEYFLLCFMNDATITSIVLYWLSVYVKSSCRPYYDMILLSPEHTYTYVDIDYFQIETLKNATLCFDTHTLECTIFDSEYKFYAKVNLFDSTFTSLMNPSTSLYQIKVSCPYYSHELVLTFSSQSLYEKWTSLFNQYVHSTSSILPTSAAPEQPFVNINLNPSLTEPEELLYQSIQHLLVCIQLSPYDSLSVLNLLSSLLYETGDIDFFYTYSIYTSIFDILNITEESITTYMDQHPNKPSFYEHYSAHELYELIQQKAIFVLYQFSCYESYLNVFLMEKDSLRRVYTMIETSQNSTIILSALHILKQAIIYSDEDYCISLLKYLPFVMNMKNTNIESTYEEMYHKVLLAILSKSLRAGTRAASEITKMDGFNFIYNIYAHSSIDSVRLEALDVFEQIYGYTSIQTYKHLSISEICLLLTLHRSSILYLSLNYLNTIFSKFSAEVKQKPMEQAAYYKEFMYIGFNITLLTDILFEILNNYYDTVENCQCLLAPYCTLIQNLCVSNQFAEQIYTSEIIFSLLNSISAASTYEVKPDQDNVNLILMTVITILHRYTGDTSNFWNNAPKNLDTSFYDALKALTLPTPILCSITLLFAVLNRFTYRAEAFVKNQRYLFLENMLNTGNEELIESGAILLSTISNYKAVADWICSLEQPRSSRLFTRVLTNFSQYSSRTVASLLYCIQILVQFRPIKQLIFNNKDTILTHLVNFSNSIYSANDTDVSYASLLNRLSHNSNSSSAKTVHPIIKHRAIRALEHLVENGSNEPSLLLTLDDSDLFLILLKCVSSTVVQGLTLQILANRLFVGCVPLKYCLPSIYYFNRAEYKSHKFGGGFIRCLVVVDQQRLILYRSSSLVPYKCFFLLGDHECKLQAEDSIVTLQFKDYVLTLKIKKDMKNFIDIISTLTGHTIPFYYSLKRDMNHELKELYSKETNLLSVRSSKSEITKIYNRQYNLMSYSISEEVLSLFVELLLTHDCLLCLLASKCLFYILSSGVMNYNDSIYILLMKNISTCYSSGLYPTSLPLSTYYDTFYACHANDWLCPVCFQSVCVSHLTCPVCGYQLMNYNIHKPMHKEEVQTVSYTPSVTPVTTPYGESESEEEEDSVSEDPSKTLIPHFLDVFPTRRAALYNYLSSILYILTTSETLCNEISSKHIELLFHALYTATPQFIYYIFLTLSNICHNVKISKVLLSYIETKKEGYMAIEYFLKDIVQNQNYSIFHKQPCYFSFITFLESLSVIDTSNKSVQILSEHGLYQFLIDVYTNDEENKMKIKEAMISLYSTKYERLLNVPIKLLLDSTIISIDEIKQSVLRSILHQPQFDNDPNLLYVLYHTFIPIVTDQLTRYMKYLSIYCPNDEVPLVLYICILNRVLQNPLLMNEDIDPSLLSLALSLFLPSLYHPQIRVQILATICNILSKDPSLIISLGAYHQYSGFSLVISSVRNLLAMTNQLSSEDQDFLRLHFIQFCLLISSIPAGIHALYKANVVHEIVSFLASGQRHLVYWSLKMLISFYKEPGFGFKTVIGSYLDASCYVPTFLTVYSTFHNDYEVMILLFTFLIHYCYNSRNILTTFSIIEKNNLLYPLVQNAREHNELVEKDEALKQLESDYHQQRVAFLRHLILYRPYQASSCLDLYVSLSSLFILSQSSLPDISLWALHVLCHRALLGFCPSMSFFKQSISPEFMTSANYKDHRSLFMKGTLYYYQSCLYIYKDESVRGSQFYKKCYTIQCSSQISQDMGNYNLSIRNHENQEILYLRGNEDLVKLNTLINEQSHVVNSESLTPETAASAPFSTPSPSTATKTKPFLLNNDLIPLIREIRQQVKESIRSRKVHDILTPFDLPYFRVSELTRDEVKYFEIFIQDGDMKNQLFVTIYSLLYNSIDNSLSNNIPPEQSYYLSSEFYTQILNSINVYHYFVLPPGGPHCPTLLTPQNLTFEKAIECQTSLFEMVVPPEISLDQFEDLLPKEIDFNLEDQNLEGLEPSEEVQEGGITPVDVVTEPVTEPIVVEPISDVDAADFVPAVVVEPISDAIVAEPVTDTAVAEPLHPVVSEHDEFEEDSDSSSDDELTHELEDSEEIMELPSEASDIDSDTSSSPDITPRSDNE